MVEKGHDIGIQTSPMSHRVWVYQSSWEPSLMTLALDGIVLGRTNEFFLVPSQKRHEDWLP